jgi:hypothetical protein
VERGRGLAQGVRSRLRTPSGNRQTEARRFGLVVGGIFLAIGLWPLVVRGAAWRQWAVLLGGALALLAVARPVLLVPLHRGWMWVGHGLGWVNTRLLLAAVYFLLMTPLGLLMRLVGRDPLDRRMGDRTSYWKARAPRTNARAAMGRRF